MNRRSQLRLVCTVLGLGGLLAVGAGCGGGSAGVESELVAKAGDTVTSFAFAPDGRLFLTEQSSGRVRIITADGEILGEPFATIDTRPGAEWGLMAVTIDPEFEENHYVYTYGTQPAGPEPNQARPVLMRFTDVNNKGENPEKLIEFPLANPEVQAHVGGSIHFGPDGYLYISIGETERGELAQDLSSPLGKLLRVTRDGEPAPDNPFVDREGADPRVYAYGFRNPFTFTFDPESGRIYLTDNGPSTCDELNIIEAGKYYGWPDSLSSGDKPCENPGGVEPIYLYAQAGKKPEEIGSNTAPTGLAFVSGEVYPGLGDGLLVCEFVPRLMRRLKLEGSGKDQVTDDRIVIRDCGVAVARDSNGIIYYSFGTEIRRLVPK